MDDAQPRHAEGGAPAPLPALSQVTILADADESSETAVEDWSRGLDWVHWLFSSIRQRQQGICFQAPPPAGTGLYPTGQSARQSLEKNWATFVTGPLATGLGPMLVQAWQAAQKRDLKSLLALDAALSPLLPPTAVSPSVQAGERLLHGTRGARYQGLLGRYRQAQSEGQTPGHFLIVWACASHFFQLSLASMVAEYLRLEWDLAASQIPGGGPPLPGDEIAALTARLMRHASTGPHLLQAHDTSSAPESATEQRHLGQ